MALLKPFTTPHGAPTEYHRLVNVEYDCQGETVTLTFQVYVNTDARQEGKQPIWHERVVVPFDSLPEDPRKHLYPMASSVVSGYLTGASSDEPAQPA